MATEERCACCAAAPDNPGRRKVIQIAAAGLAAPAAVFANPTAALPTAGDVLVEEDQDGTPKPLRISDLRPGKPMLAFPMDPKTKVVRNESRLNKIVLMRFAEGDLSAATKPRAAGGVVAYSAICTHQACDVKTWLSGEQALVCFCHASKFQLRDEAKVTAGPAPRALPSLPLRLDGETLVVAGKFSGQPGAA